MRDRPSELRLASALLKQLAINTALMRMIAEGSDNPSARESYFNAQKELLEIVSELVNDD